MEESNEGQIFTIYSPNSRSSMTSEELILKRRLIPEETVNFDSAYRRCSLFTGISDNTKRCKFTDRIYNTLVLVFLYSNLFRTTIQCFLPYGSPWILWLGDFKIWWGRPYIAHQVVFLMAVLVVPAVLTLNITACPLLKRWCLPFKFTQGLITAEEAKLWKVSAIQSLKKKVRFNYKRAFIATFSVNWPYGLSVLVSYLLFYETWMEFLLLGIPWTIYETIWSFYITSNMGLLPNSFDIVCYYLRLRYGQIEELLTDLNRNCSQLSTNKSLLPRIRYQMDKLFLQLDDTNKDVIDYDKYWSKYTTIVFMSYIPQLLFEFYVFIFLPMNSSVLIFSLLLNLNIFALITQMAMFSAILHKKANEVYAKLNSTLIKMDRTFKKAKTNKILALRQKLYFSMFIERYSSRKPLGIYVLDIKLMDSEFYYHLLVEGMLYFLLIVSLLKSN